MLIFWKSVAVAAVLAAAYNGIEDSAKVILPGTQSSMTQATVGAVRNAAASPIVAALAEIEGVNTWRAILTRSGYAPSGTGPVTILVPSDAAFAMGDERSLESQVGADDAKKLARVVEGTVIGRPLDPAEFAGKKISVMTLAGNSVTLDATDQSLMVGDAEILAVKHASDGSVVYIVDHLPTNTRASDAFDDKEYRE